MDHDALKSFLNEKADFYNRPDFIQSDPIRIPHRFSHRYDIELSAFLTATIAWGQRLLIIRSAERLMSLMGHSPYEFVMEADNNHINRLGQFVHRTFNGTDLQFFVQSLRHLYIHHGGLEGAFCSTYATHRSIAESLKNFRQLFLSIAHPARSRKHLADVANNASAKRLNMFLRWMVRQDNRGVDFGLWPAIPACDLYLPLDLHTGNIARKLGLLARKQNDWKAVEEVTAVLRTFDPTDPVRYDFALFGLGINEKF